jgi:RNA polymerase sigma factor (sigma-70 family)
MSMSKRYFLNQDERITVVNNCFLKLMNSLKTYKFEGVFEAWCRKLMTNTIIDEYRKNKRWKETIQLSEHIIDNKNDVMISASEEKYSVEQLEAMLLKLPEATRCVFNLFAVEGYSHQEIAGMLSISEGTSKWHVSKAREELKKMLVTNHTVKEILING